MQKGKMPDILPNKPTVNQNNYGQKNEFNSSYFKNKN